MGAILYETDEQRNCPHTSWQKVEATDETYWRCFDCGVTADKPTHSKEANLDKEETP